MPAGPLSIRVTLARHIGPQAVHQGGPRLGESHRDREAPSLSARESLQTGVDLADTVCGRLHAG